MRWQAASEIVRAFVRKDKPNHALVALGMILLTIAILVITPFVLLR